MPRKINYGVDYDEEDYDVYDDYDYDDDYDSDAEVDGGFVFLPLMLVFLSILESN